MKKKKKKNKYFSEFGRENKVFTMELKHIFLPSSPLTKWLLYS